MKKEPLTLIFHKSWESVASGFEMWEKQFTHESQSAKNNKIHCLGWPSVLCCCGCWIFQHILWPFQWFASWISVSAKDFYFAVPLQIHVHCFAVLSDCIMCICHACFCPVYLLSGVFIVYSALVSHCCVSALYVVPCNELLLPQWVRCGEKTTHWGDVERCWEVHNSLAG